MLSGRAASRTGQLSDTASKHTFGGWQGGHHRRWQIYVTASRNHYTCHRGWSTHVTTRRYRQAQPNQLAIRSSRNIRRPRHECETSTAQASLEWHEHRINKTSSAGGHGGPPLHRILRSAQNRNRLVSTNLSKAPSSTNAQACHQSLAHRIQKTP